MNDSAAAKAAVAILRSPETIRERAQLLLRLARQDKLQHFSVSEQGLAATCAFVAKVIKHHYPDLKIPYHSRWQHFNVGGIDRVKNLGTDTSVPREGQRCLSPNSTGPMKFDLAIISVLLDAGAGTAWSYTEKSSGKKFARSEGLAVASLDMFRNGLFSANEDEPLRVDAEALKTLTLEQLSAGMQVSKNNPLTGLEGRLHLLQRLGESIANQPHIFGKTARLGNLFDHIVSLAKDGAISAGDILKVVLNTFSSIWPSRFSLGDENLGDVWRHSAVETRDLTSGYVPFHKLSQWLSYSLFEPLEEAGYKISQMHLMTGLAEYRNGGLFVDMEALVPKDPKALTRTYRPDDELVVEWRALTIALLDELASEVRRMFGLTPQQFPLAKVLQGGTWNAGRQIAQEKRGKTGGGPPLQIESDGTLF